jgi:hypothetical protein
MNLFRRTPKGLNTTIGRDETKLPRISSPTQLDVGEVVG